MITPLAGQLTPLTLRRRAAAFNPASVAGLKYWFDAAALGLSSGAAVTSWPDASGNGRNLGPGAGTPTYIAAALNGRGAVRFGGAASLKTSVFAALATPTVFIVYRQRDTTGADKVVFGSPPSIAVFLEAVTGTKTGAYAGGTEAFANEPYPVAPRCVTVRFEGAAAKMYRDGVQVAAASVGTSTLTGLSLGGSYTGTFLSDVDVYEALVYDGPVSAPDQTAVEAYLKTKWGLPSVYGTYYTADFTAGGGLAEYPSLLRLPSGDLLTALMVAPTGVESDPNNSVGTSRSTDGGVTWTAATGVYSETGNVIYTDLGMCQLASGTILWPILVYVGSVSGAHSAKMLTSADNGATWGTPSTIPPPAGHQWIQTYGLIRELTPGGTLWMPAYGSPTGQTYTDSMLLQSADHGATWTLKSVIAAGDATPHGPSETDVLPLGGSNVLAVYRQDEAVAGDTTLWSRTSADGGATWGAATQLLAASNRAISPSLTKLASGNVLLLAGIRPGGTPTQGVVGTLSTDGGATWGASKYVWTQADATFLQGYPTAVQLPDGVILIQWFHVHQIFSQGFDESFFA